MFIYSQIAGLSLVAGGLLLAHAHNRKNAVSNILKRGIKTDGKVIEIRRNPGSLFSSKEGEGYAPVVEYTTASGNILKHFSTTYRPICPYREGQIVPISYINYKSIREAALSDDEPGDLPRKLFIIGIVCFLFGLPALISGLPNFF
jgi:hypothetical protein